MIGETPYEIHAVRYATVQLPSGHSCLGEDFSGALRQMDYYIWVVRNESRVIVVDTGFHKTIGEARGRTMLVDPQAALNALNIRSEDVRDVILTHLHYDHVGNYACFPNAQFHLQDKEMSHATGRSMCHSRMQAPYEYAEIAGILERIFFKNVTFHDGDTTIAPGISLHLIGGHSPGLQVVRVQTARGFVVIASDASHFYAGFRDEEIFPIVYNIGDLLEGYRKILSLASSHDHVIPGHDPLVLQRYPASSPELHGVAVRLDLDPILKAETGTDC